MKGIQWLTNAFSSLNQSDTTSHMRVQYPLRSHENISQSFTTHRLMEDISMVYRGQNLTLPGL